jgi:hypothetical protein
VGKVNFNSNANEALNSDLKKINVDEALNDDFERKVIPTKHLNSREKLNQ